MPSRTAPHSGPEPHPDAAAASPAVEIRHLRTHREFAECVELQRATWGADFSECVPVAILKVSQRIGGITAGAFDAEGRLAGFVFGLTGIENGALVHWSDMLAVRADLRNHGIGQLLKTFQYEELRRRGVTRMYWTFDPLVARNAHLNINRLGASVVEYVRDMYGSDTSSVLHRGIGSDRLVVAWAIAAAGPAAGAREPALDAQRAAPILNAVDSRGLPTKPDAAAPRSAAVRIAIPADLDRVQAQSLADAAQWRSTTRAAFEWALAHGYRVHSLQRDERSGRAYYVLAATADFTAP